LHNNLVERLKRLERPIRIGIVGTGSIGQGLYYQSSITPGIRCIALADIKPERAIQCAVWLKRDYRVVRSVDAMNAAVEVGLLAICEDASLIAQCDQVDVFLDASGAIAAAGKFCATALRHRKHLVMMNAEADLIFGPYLMRLAQENGMVYTSCDGDQHVVIKHLADELRFWGFELVMAGNIKGFLDRYSNPTKIIPEADKRKLDYRMATAYTDGTKVNVEMALVANSLGLCAPVSGMRGPRAHDVRDALELFDLPVLWQSKEPVVDYILGAEPKGGVFAIGYTDNAYQQSMLAWLPPKLGEGPFYIFYRPYHLCHIEALSTVAMAALDHQSDLQPNYGFQTNVFAYAKRNLRSGEELDGIGGYTCYGLIENAGKDSGNPGLPICLTEKMKLNRDIARDEKILLSDVSCDADRDDVRLYESALEASKSIQA
jgi:predicted homoserine dehydrogenase-like protein